jgi:hypothetical protein
VKCGSGHLNHLGVCSYNGRVLLAAHAALGMYGSGAVLAPLYCDGICRVCSGFHNVAVICGGWFWLQTSHYCLATPDSKQAQRPPKTYGWHGPVRMMCNRLLA